MEAAKPTHRFNVNLLTQIQLYTLQCLGTRLEWFPVWVCLFVCFKYTSTWKNCVSPGIFSVGNWVFEARTFLWVPSIHSTEILSGGIWYKSIRETELLTLNLFALVSCPDVQAVLHVLWRDQTSEWNPFHKKWEVLCQLSCCSSNLGFRGLSPSHWWHQL